MFSLSRVRLAARLLALALCGTACCEIVHDALVAARATAAEQPAATDNPYLAAPRLSRTELAEFVRKMQIKPASVRKRPGFQEAIIDAADRILSSGEQDDLAAKALLDKLSAMHYLADKGDKQADEQLAKLAAAHGQDERKEVAEGVRFYLIERQALDADALEPADLASLLAELKKYCESHELDARHLRMASATVRIINRLPDDKAAAEAYREFGGWFTKSEDPELSRYGRKIVTGPKGKAKAEAPPAAEPAAESDEP
jgi:hypothetical protein